jgi:hypothetical protein
MLPDRVQLLLAAALDGDLTPRQRRLVRRWLKRSRRARLYFQQLQADQAQLKRLPLAEMPLDFSKTVLAAIAGQGMVQPAALVSARPTHRWQATAAPWAVAAAIFLAIALGSFAFFHNSGYTPDQVADAKPTRPSAAPGQPAPNIVAAVSLPQAGQPAPAPPPPGPPPDAVAAAAPAPTPGTTVPSTPEVTAPETVPLTGEPSPRPTVVQVARPPLPLPLAPRDLGQAAARQKLLEELRKHEIAHIDLMSAFPTRACERLQTALQGQGLKVLADPLAAERVGRRLPGEFQFAVYLDGVTAEQLVLALERFGAEDHKGEERAFVGPLQSGDAREFLGLSGAELFPTALNQPRTPNVDARKPLSEGTGAHVTQSLSGQGGHRPAAGKPGEVRAALVLTYPAPARVPIVTREMKQYLDARKPLPADRLAVFLIVR